VALTNAGRVFLRETKDILGASIMRDALRSRQPEDAPATYRSDISCRRCSDPASACVRSWPRICPT
jgi:hypothetical protein